LVASLNRETPLPTWHLSGIKVEAVMEDLNFLRLYKKSCMARRVRFALVAAAVLMNVGAGKKSNATYAGNRKEMRKQARHPAKFSGPPAGRPQAVARPQPVEKPTIATAPPPPLKRKIAAEPSKSEGQGTKKITATASTPLSRMLGEAPVEEESEVEDVAPKKKKKAPLELPSSMGGAGGGKEEDDEIEWLEWKLGLKGKKGKGKSKAKTDDEDLDDGLDGMLWFHLDHSAR
jgi:hypothetical protein